MSNICTQFHNNPSIDPRTSNYIKINSPAYNKLVDECGVPPILTLMQQTYISSQNKQTTQLKVATINVEFYNTCNNNRNCPRFFDLIDRVEADVICVQEEISQRHMTLNNYEFIGSCNGGNLGNSIYVNKNSLGTISEFKDIDITQECVVRRCGFFINIKGVTIVNVHLCGGRYDDVSYQQLQRVRYNQISKIIDSLGFVPDLIVGDFNGESTIESARNTLKNYPFVNNLKDSEKEKFFNYYSSHILALEKYGYKPAYTVQEIGPTSKFGGNPDWMYYLNTKLSPISADMIPLLEYTDHNGVVVNFNVK